MGCPGVLYPPGPLVTVRMRLLLVLALLASAAQAQARLAPAERLLMGVGGATAGTLVLVAANGRAPAFTLPASPLVAGFVVYGLGAVLNPGGRLVPTLVGAAAGTLPALLMLGVAESAGDGSGVMISEDDLLRVFAVLAYVVVPPAGAVIGFERFGASPVVLAGPDGERTAGLALRTSF